MVKPTQEEQQPAIVFQNVRKVYSVPRRETPRVGAWLLNKVFEHFTSVPFAALDDVSFSVPKGQCIGLLGQNGAGKSTTLKLMAGITQPTTGTVTVRGRVASMLELGVGFHPDLSGMENIFYNAILMGLSREQVLERLETMIAFSGLNPNFLQEPVKHYSSGMYSRLACSVALHLDADILLIDEILAVGDAGFQQRGMLRILELNDRGATVVLVSHIITTMKEMCDRLIWIRDGKLHRDGPADEVEIDYRRYMKNLSFAPNHPLKQLTVIGTENLSNHVRITGLELVSAYDPVLTEKPCALLVHLDWAEAPTRPYRLGLYCTWKSGQLLFRDETEPISVPLEKLEYTIPRWPFLSTAVHFSVAVLDAETGAVLHVNRDALVVESRTDNLANNTRAVFVPQATWKVEALIPSAPESNSPDRQRASH